MTPTSGMREYDWRLLRSLEIIDEMNAARTAQPKPEPSPLRPLMDDEYLFRGQVRQEREDFNEQRDRIVRER